MLSNSPRIQLQWCNYLYTTLGFKNSLKFILVLIIIVSSVLLVWGRPKSTSRSRGGGPRRCDSSWQGEGDKSMWRHTYNKFYHTYETWNLKWCLTFCCKQMYSDRRENGQNPPRTRPSRPWQNPLDKNPNEQLRENLYRGLLSGFLNYAYWKWGVRDMWRTLGGSPEMCDKVWQGKGNKIGQK